ncbi:hypothetical protein LOAG_06140 [Loa loa]|uniref:Uncharacterized protein n=1 Tax=Loa loa TaxID=7209 RepID=A0A1I7VS06_LOALO|nr:hypothetical protein LOAG_06140 [Loa loa]EFO22347.2 hypothetical protein LOAG_06140 [Loa loa]
MSYFPHNTTAAGAHSVVATYGDDYDDDDDDNDDDDDCGGIGSNLAGNFIPIALFP